MSMVTFPFEYRRLGDFTYHVLHEPGEIKSYLMKWIMREWELDHDEAPHEHWTVTWMENLPRMEFSLQVIQLDDIYLNADLMGVKDFQHSLEERAALSALTILRLAAEDA